MVNSLTRMPLAVTNSSWKRHAVRSKSSPTDKEISSSENSCINLFLAGSYFLEDFLDIKTQLHSLFGIA